MVTVRLPSILQKYADDTKDIDVDASSLEGALRRLCEIHPDLEARLFRQGLIAPHILIFHQDELIKPERIEDAAFDPDQRIDILVPVSGGADVRMRGFKHRVPVEDALVVALEGISLLPTEHVPVTAAAGRVLSDDVVSGVNVPPFRRSGMDGYAVRAEDTFGATEYDPVTLPLVGTSMPGRGPDAELAPHTALRIMTGAPVPDAADAVLKAEDATEENGVVHARAAVAVGKNVGRVGEDIDEGTVVLRAGHRLRPQDVGLLSSIGADPVPVHRRPKVRIIVSGDELLPPGSKPEGHHIVDANSLILSALVERDGGIAEVVRIPDDEAAMRAALEPNGVDVIITSGAASVGTEDRVPLLVADRGELPVHGVAMRPSSPTGVGLIDDAKVLVLPGNPVSCLVAYDFFAGPVIRFMGGRTIKWPYRSVDLPLGERMVSQIGRTDYARVRIEDDLVYPVAISGASVLSSVTKADGFVVIPAGLEGYRLGDTVTVGLYEMT